MNNQLLAFAVAAVVAGAPCQSANLDRATFTEVVNSVNVIERTTRKTSTAKVADVFAAPNVIRTGIDSRAELIANDKTVTRVGQNSIFSFTPGGRDMELQKGSILFQSPSGQGGGNIRTSSASAAVLGTTIVVSATSNGGFKVLLLEGNGRVVSRGVTRNLNAGQMVYALPGGKLSGVFTFQLKQQTGASKLVRGFKRALPSLAKINSAIAQQEQQLAAGNLQQTGLLASGSPDIAYQVDIAVDAQEPAEETEVAKSAFAAAIASDAFIRNPKLAPSRLFGPGLNDSEFSRPPSVYSPESGDTLGDPAQRPAIFLGNNIAFQTDSVNLAPAEGRDVLQFFARRNLDFRTSTDFGKSSAQIQFIAGGRIRNQAGSLLEFDAPGVFFGAFGRKDGLQDQPAGAKDVRHELSTTLTGLRVVNHGGGIAFAGGDFNLNGVGISAQALQFSSSGKLDFSSLPGTGLPQDGEIFADDGPLPPNNTNLTSEQGIRMASDRGISIAAASLRAPFFDFKTDGPLSLQSVRISDGTGLRGQDANPPQMPGSARVRMYSGGLLSLSSVRFTANDAHLIARTISLENINFRNGSRIWLESDLGVLADFPNSSRPIVPGKVNFIRNVRYAGQNITNPSHPAIIQNGVPISGSGTPQGPGIVIRPRR